MAVLNAFQYLIGNVWEAIFLIKMSSLLSKRGCFSFSFFLYITNTRQSIWRDYHNIFWLYVKGNVLVKCQNESAPFYYSAHCFLFALTAAQSARNICLNHHAKEFTSKRYSCWAPVWYESHQILLKFHKFIHTLRLKLNTKRASVRCGFFDESHLLWMWTIWTRIPTEIKLHDHNCKCFLFILLLSCVNERTWFIMKRKAKLEMAAL